MEQRKQKEIEYYDKEAGETSLDEKKEAGSGHSFDLFLLTSYQFLRKLVLKKAKDKKILDYGCGTGVHLNWLAEIGEKVIGIDLSEKSLEIAKKRYEIQDTKYNIQFLKMDCEKLEFPDNSFDIIFDGGTFSSLDLNRVYFEISRVLKLNGYLIGIETFGHNPLTNLKRKINEIRGRRTSWASGHILKNKDLREAKKYFNKVEVYYFHLISWLAFPFLNLPGGKAFLKLLEFIDKILLRLTFLRKYAFKVVFVFSGPNKKS